MNQFAILGSGFGLYGYLPALISCGQNLMMPERYRARFQARSELASFAPRVQWGRDEEAVLDNVKGVVLALQPSLQCHWLTRCLARPQLERLLLEKPLAQSPQLASQLFDQLIHSGKVFRIGYIFRYTHWGQQLLSTLKKERNAIKISIKWHFLAHHFRHQVQTWKRFHKDGGAAIRFYGIHIIALLAELGYQEVVLSETSGSIVDEYGAWQALFLGEGLPEFAIDLDSNSLTNQFQITQTLYSAQKRIQTITTHLLDPFDLGSQKGSPGEVDLRIPILSQLCHSLWEPNTNEYNWYASTIKLWQAVEDKTLFHLAMELQ